MWPGVQAEPQVGDRIGVDVVGAALVAVQPVFERLGVQAAADFADEAVAHGQADLAFDDAHIGQYPQVARLDHDLAMSLSGTYVRFTTGNSLQEMSAILDKACKALNNTIIHSRID